VGLVWLWQLPQVKGSRPLAWIVDFFRLLVEVLELGACVEP